MPFSARLTACTCRACSSIDMFLCITPIPPSRAMAIASLASVTVSIAAEIKGTLSVMLRENWVVNDTSLGRTSEYPGMSNTSSNVIPSILTRSAINDIKSVFSRLEIYCAQNYINSSDRQRKCRKKLSVLSSQPLTCPCACLLLITKNR